MAFVEAGSASAETRAAPGAAPLESDRAKTMTTTLILSATALAITAMLCLAATRAWQGWLALKQLEIDRVVEPEERESEGEVGLRIELAAVRERLKKLEAIASGVEL